MRRGIGLRGYAQQDPLNEFRKEAFRLYEELSGLIRRQVATTIFRVTVQREPATVPLSGPRPAGAAGRRHGTRPPARARRCARADERRRTARGGSGGRGRRRPAATRAALAAGGAALRATRRRRRWRPRRRPDARPPARRPATRRRPAASARASPRRAPGSGATTRAGADRARSTRSATGPDPAGRGDLVRLVHRRRPRRRRACGAFAAVRIWQQGDRDEQRPADAIVVLGAAQYDGRPSPVFEARLDHAVQLWQSRASPTRSSSPAASCPATAPPRRPSPASTRSTTASPRRRSSARTRPTTRSTRCGPSPRR